MASPFRENALAFLTEKLRNINLQRHCFSVAAIMDGLADHFLAKGEKLSKDNWWLAGVLHDVDYEQTKDDIHMHSKLGAEWLKEKGYPEEVVKAVLVHNDAHGLPQETLLEKALVAADGLSGLLVAAALILPDKKLSSLSTDSVLRRFKEKAFARGVSREEILSCERLGLSLEEFTAVGLVSLQTIAVDIGL